MSSPSQHSGWPQPKDQQRETKFKVYVNTRAMATIYYTNPMNEPDLSVPFSFDSIPTHGVKFSDTF